MSRSDRLSLFADQEGFTILIAPDMVVAQCVPCLLAKGTVSFCAIEKSCDPVSKRPTSEIGGAVHGVRVRLDKVHDGRVYQANGEPIGNLINSDGKTWSDISIKKGSQDSPEDDVSASDLIHRYAKQILGAVSAAGHLETAFLVKQGPLKIPNTFEARAAIGPVQDRIRDQRIAIIGLGGTGAYVLDLVAKTPVKEIHLLDSDQMDWHNFMRAPGAPTCEEIKSMRNACLRKVDYYHAKYTSLRQGIYAHALRVDNSTMFAAFLSTHPVDYAFVCIDQQKDCDAPRQDAVYAALSESGTPFIDSGVSITLENDAVRGAITTSAHDAGTVAWKKAIPNARMCGNAPGYRNIQLPEVNALAAALAVVEWRRQTGQYVSSSTSFLHKFRLENGDVRRA